MNRTRASEILRERLNGHGDQEKFRRRFNEALPEAEQIDAPTASRWVNGKLRPSPEQMARIEDLEEIPMRLWAERVEEGAA